MRQIAESVHEIKSRSEQATSITRSILGDARSVSGTNNALDEYCFALKQLRKLMDSIGEIEREITDNTQYGYYRMVADMLVDVKEEMKYFAPFAAIPKVIELKEKVQIIEDELKRQIHWALREIGELVENDASGNPVPTGSAEPSAHLQSLQDMYLVVEVLGEACRRDILERLSQLQLIAYEKKFQAGKQFSGLTNLDQRYAWFRRLIKAAEDKLSSVFPSKWNIGYHFYLEFCRRTKNHLHEQLTILEKQDLDDKQYMHELLKALKSVLNFEKEMKMQLTNDEEDGGDAEEKKLAEFIGDAFDPFLGPYVQVRPTLYPHYTHTILYLYTSLL